MGNLLNQFLASPGQIRFAFVIVVFLAVALFLFTVLRWISRLNAPEIRRVKEIVGQSASQSGAGRYKKVLDSAAPYVVPKASKELSEALKQLNYAGYKHPNAATIFYAIKMITGLILGIAAFVYIRYLGTYQLGNINRHRSRSIYRHDYSK
jgi:hypothetical protein